MKRAYALTAALVVLAVAVTILADGSWDAESNRDGQFGNVYTTALAVLALTPPYQLLPIHQR